MLEIDQGLFEQLQTPAWLLNIQGQVLYATQSAQKLLTTYQINLDKVLEIAQGKGCARHGLQSECLNCPVEDFSHQERFPFEVLDAQGQEVMLWGRLYTGQTQLLLQVYHEGAGNNSQQNHSLFEYLNNARELERKRIAQDLHDGIAQSIYSLMLETRLLKWLPTEEQKAKLAEIDAHFTEVLAEVKDLASEMRPMTIDAFGLVPALEQFITRTEEMTGFEIEMEIEGQEQALTEGKRIAIYRSIQEAIANALKYAKVNEAKLRLDYRGPLQVSITDAGQGFDLSKNAQGFGLLNMRERIQAIGGDLVIETQPGQGTKVLMIIPLSEHESD